MLLQRHVCAKPLGVQAVTWAAQSHGLLSGPVPCPTAAHPPSLPHCSCQARDDVVTRHTRFSTKAPLPTVLASIESAAVGSGGRVEREEEGR